MTPRNQAVKALAALPALRATLDYYPPAFALADVLERGLREAPTFVVEADLFISTKDLAKTIGVVKLPTEWTFVEAATGESLLAGPASFFPMLELAQDSTVVWPVVDGALTPVGMAIKDSDLVHAAETDILPAVPILLTPDAAAYQAKVDFPFFAGAHNRRLAELCCLLACRNLTTERVEPSPALNKRRAERGKLPLRAFNVVVVRMDETRRVGARGAHDHASPRSHLRRGHIRRLEKGVVWVSQCVINPGNGWVGKRYELRA